MLLLKRDIAVEIRFAEKSGSVKAYADITLTFSDGDLQLIGFAIIEHPGKDLYVAFPQNRGRNRYFPVVAAKGDLHEGIVGDILRAYKQAKERK